MDTIQVERTDRSATLLTGDAVFLHLEGGGSGEETAVNQRLHRSAFVLSSFSYLRWLEEPVLASACHRARAGLADPRAVAMVAAFAAPLTVREVCARVPGLGRDVAEAAVRLLAGAGLLDRVPGGPDSPDGTDDARGWGGAAVAAGWSFADLLFRTSGGSGDHPAATRSPGHSAGLADGEGLSLPRWTPGRGRVADVDALLDRRASVRTYDDVPLDRASLGAFLDLAQGVQGAQGAKVVQAAPGAQGSGLLEPAVLVRACTGLAPGLYRHVRASHTLVPLGPWSPDLDRMVADATGSVDGASSPVQVLVVLFAAGLRAGTYADVLVEVGRHMQQMYLAAAMLGLAGCALGAGDSGAFARASGLDPLTHPSVGEFLLGSKAEETT